MAQITISEKDLTTANITTINDNIAYIPGYANIGPTTPTLCNNLNEFRSIFGSKPYIFKEDQIIPGVQNALALAGEAEKSYIYASELLNQGLSVLFQRIYDSSKVASTIPLNNLSKNQNITITAKYAGSYGTNISGTFTNISGTTEEISYELANPQPTQENFSENNYYTEDNGQYIIADNFEDGTQYYIQITNTVPVTPIIYNLNIVLGASEELGIKEQSQLISNISFDDPTSPNYYTNINSPLVNINVEKINTVNDVSTEPVQFTLQLNAPAGETDEFNLTNFYNYIGNEENYNLLIDKNEYQIKYITTGSYPVYFNNNPLIINNTNIIQMLLNVAATRGDVVALIDCADEEINNDWIQNIASVAQIQQVANENSKYGAMFAPWGTYSIKNLNTTALLPGSFAYLSCLANSIKTSADWYAIAGVNRGYVSNLIQLSQIITGAVSELLQPEIGVSVNTILNVKPYGYCIWGNRTLNNNNGLIASSFLNIRNLTNNVKKAVYRAAKKLTFEQNSNILWLNFKSEIEPLLDKMVSDNGLLEYKILKVATDKRATIKCIIRLVAIEAVEDWDITIELTDSYTSVE